MDIRALDESGTHLVFAMRLQNASGTRRDMRGHLMIASNKQLFQCFNGAGTKGTNSTCPECGGRGTNGTHTFRCVPVSRPVSPTDLGGLVK